MKERLLVASHPRVCALRFAPRRLAPVNATVSTQGHGPLTLGVQSMEPCREVQGYFCVQAWQVQVLTSRAGQNLLRSRTPMLQEIHSSQRVTRAKSGGKMVCSYFPWKLVTMAMTLERAPNWSSSSAMSVRICLCSCCLASSGLLRLGLLPTAGKW